jgi:phosphohistidine phosphatase
MKTLLLMRHAKSSWKDAESADKERPLSHRGEKDALLMGTAIKEKELVPQFILGSSALRVRETANAVMSCSEFVGEAHFLDELYLAEPEAYLKVLKTLRVNPERLMIIGHNPGLEGLLQQLSGRIESLSTGTIAYICLPIQSWGELDEKVRGECIEILEPRSLAEGEKETYRDKKGKKEKKSKKAKNAFRWVTTYFDKPPKKKG